jgi:hypothetical protein
MIEREKRLVPVTHKVADYYGVHVPSGVTEILTVVDPDESFDLLRDPSSGFPMKMDDFSNVDNSRRSKTEKSWADLDPSS